MSPTPCNCPHSIVDAGQPVTLACSINRGHTGTHQAYHRDQLHHWPQPPTS